MKKIILGAGILILASTTFAVGGNMTGSASSTNNNDGLMGNFNNLVNEVKTDSKINKDIICTKEYAPVCGSKGDDEKTYSNSCEAKKDGAKFLHNGKCGDSDGEGDKFHRLPPEHIDPTGLKVVFDGDGNKITGKLDSNGGVVASIKDIHSKISVKNNKKEEGGIHKKAKMSEEGKEKDGDKWEWKMGVSSETSEEGSKKWEKDIKVDFLFDDGKIKIDGDNGLNFKTGVRLNNNLIKIDTDSEGKNEIKIFGQKHNIEIKSEDSAEVKIENGLIKVGDTEINIDIDKTIEKAKSKAGADIVLNSEIKKDDDGVYLEVKTQKKTKFLGLFDFNMDQEIKVDLKTGAVIDVDEPWYSFLLF